MAEAVERRPQFEWRFEDIISITMRWKWVLIFFSLTIPIISYIFSITITPLYTSSCTVTVGNLTPESQALGYGRYYTQKIRNANEEGLFIRSRMVLSEVVRELRLDISLTQETKLADQIVNILKGRQSKPVNYRDHVTQINLSGDATKGVFLEFDTPHTFLVLTMASGKFIGKGELGKLFQNEQATFIVDSLPAKMQDKFVLQRFLVEQVAAGLAPNVNVESIGTGGIGMTLSMAIRYSDSDPINAKDTVNAIAVAYLKRSLEESTQNYTQILQFIDQQMTTISERVNANLTEVEDYKKGLGLSFIEQAAQLKMGSITQLEYKKDQNRNQIAIMENLISILQTGGTVSDQDLMMANNLQGTLVPKLVTSISDLKIEREAMAQKFTEEHPAMKENKARIEQTMARVLDGLRSQINYLKAEMDMCDEAIKRYTGELDNMNEGRRNMNRLTQVGAINQRMLSYLIQRNEETKIARAGIVPDVQIVEPASGARLVRPLRDRYVLSGILAGILIGIAMMLFLEYLDNTIKTAEWVERELHVPVFGMIPNFFSPTARRERPQSTQGQRDINLILQQDPKSHVAEAYRSLRTNIQFADLESKLKIILITSPGPREGKSTSIANLAITMANMGSKTLIIDCDMRKPIMHRFFGLSRDRGISDILARNTDWHEAINPTGIDNCFVLTSGKTPPNPSELLGSKRMENLLKEVREEFDVVLIDSSPIIAVTDAVVLGTRVDAIFMVFEMGRTTMDVAAQSMNILDTVHLKPRGVILNNMRPEDRRAYGYGYGYGYGGGYGYGYKYYKYYNYYNYYYGEDREEPKGFIQSLVGKIQGRKG